MKRGDRALARMAAAITAAGAGFAEAGAERRGDGSQYPSTKGVVVSVTWICPCSPETPRRNAVMVHARLFRTRPHALRGAGRMLVLDIAKHLKEETEKR